jgi:hypothetical protein
MEFENQIEIYLILRGRLMTLAHTTRIVKMLDYTGFV